MAVDRPALLVVAAAAELYGSDRTLLASMPDLLAAFDVTVMTPATGPALARLEAAGATVVVLPDYALRRRHLTPRGLLPWLARCTSAVRTMHRRHRRRPFALVYSNTMAAGLGPVLARRWGVPHLLHVHECVERPGWLAPVLFTLARLRTDRVVCNSEYTRAWVARTAPRLAGRAVVVYNGIELPAPTAARSAAAPAGGSAPLRITCVGRIHPKKGQWVLLEAAGRALRAGRRWELHFFGDNLPEHAELMAGLRQQVVDEHLGDAVTWHGFVDDVHERYEGYDVAVVPSVQAEEFSLVCVEAQSLEVAVVATGPGGPSEVLVDGVTGLVVPIDDAVALEAAIARLDDDPDERVAMGRRGRDRMLAEFSQEVYGARIHDAVQDLVAAARR